MARSLFVNSLNLLGLTNRYDRLVPAMPKPLDPRMAACAAFLLSELQARKTRAVDLAKLLNVKPSLGSVMLTGKRRIPTKHFRVIAEHLDVPVEEYFATRKTRTADLSRHSQGVHLSELDSGGSTLHAPAQGPTPSRTLIAELVKAATAFGVLAESAAKHRDHVRTVISDVRLSLPSRQIAVARGHVSGNDADVRGHHRRDASQRRRKRKQS